MCYRTAVFVLTSFLVIQVDGTTNALETTTASYNMLDPITQLLEALSDIIAKVIAFGRSAIAELQENTTALLMILSEGAFDLINEQMQQSLNNLREKASEYGADVLECFNDTSERLNSSLRNAIETFANCSSSDVNKLLTDMDLLLGEIDKANSAVKNLEPEIASCSNATNITSCMEKFEGDVQTVLSGFSSGITEDVQAIADGLTNLGDQIAICLKEGTIAFQKTELAIVNDVGVCIYGEINNGTAGEVETLVEILTNIVSDFINNTRAAITNLQQNSTVQDFLVGIVKESFTQISDAATEDLKRIEKQAEDDGKNISKCLTNTSLELNNALESSLKTFGNCSTVHLGNIFLDLSDFLDDLAIKNDQVKEYERQLYSCANGTDANATDCLNVFKKQVESVFSDIPAFVVKNGGKIITDIVTFGTDTQLCFKSGTSGLQQSDTDIIDKVSGCIKLVNGAQNLSRITIIFLITLLGLIKLFS